MSKVNILVTRMGNIGDMLLITPLLAAIKANISQSQVYVLSPKYSKEVLIRNPDVDYLFVFYTKMKRFRNRIHNMLLFNRLEKIYFDFLFCLDMDENVVSFLRRLPRIGTWIGFRRPAEVMRIWRENIHVADNYLFLLKELLPSVDIEVYRKRPFFFVPRRQKEKIKSFLAQYGLFEPVLICPCASEFKPSRLWPTKNWIFLIQRLLKKANIPIIVVSKNKKEKPIPELYRCFYKKIYFWYNKSLTETAALMSLAKTIICLDSGTLHLATAVSTGKVISLFGPSNPAHTGPYPEDVPQWKIVRNFSCQVGPCNTFPREKIPQECLYAEFTPCMERINVESVWRALLD